MFILYIQNIHLIYIVIKLYSNINKNFIKDGKTNEQKYYNISK